MRQRTKIGCGFRLWKSKVWRVGFAICFIIPLRIYIWSIDKMCVDSFKNTRMHFGVPNPGGYLRVIAESPVPLLGKLASGCRLDSGKHSIISWHMTQPWTKKNNPPAIYKCFVSDMDANFLPFSKGCGQWSRVKRAKDQQYLTISFLVFVICSFKMENTVLVQVVSCCVPDSVYEPHYCVSSLTLLNGKASTWPCFTATRAKAQTGRITCWSCTAFKRHS